MKPATVLLSAKLRRTLHLMHYYQLKYNLLNRQLLLLLAIATVLFSCNNKEEVLNTEHVTDYLPLAIGKSVTYRLDSTVFVKSGSVIETHKYQVRLTIAEKTTDNTGKEAFIVRRAFNNETASEAWVNNGTLIITPYEHSIAVTDNNLRTTVLQDPMKPDFNWNGNSTYPSAPYQTLFNGLETGKDMNKWKFKYSTFNINETINSQQYANVWTIEQRNELLNIPPTSGTNYGYKETATEKYAKGIGLVYKDFQLYDFQGPSADNPSAHYTGFGITMWMISHN